jgi:hypothetical protein
MLGSVRRWHGLAPRQFVSKPYQYGPLIRKIEELLEESAGDVAQATREAA